MIVAKTSLKKIPKTCKQCDYRAIYHVGGEDICRIAGLFCPYEKKPNGMFGLGKPDWCPLMDEAELTGNSVKGSETKQYADVATVQYAGWISVEGRLPENSGLYLVIEKHWLDGSLGTKIAKWNTVDWFTADRKSKEITPRVTHWMPLPQPPKGE